ncbi:hypothetical protein [Sulfuricurvum sp.]|uniref:hypothetical protein n=1 Tax=Sulfuricurvum sp. TaxID=2025608 RepID=UPI003BB789D8
MEEKIIEFMNFKQGRGTKSAYLYEYKALIATAVEMRSCKDLAAFLKLTEKENLVIKQKSEAELLQDIYEYTAREKRINRKKSAPTKPKKFSRPATINNHDYEEKPDCLKVVAVAEAKALAKKHFNKYLDALTPEEIIELREQHGIDVAEAVSTIQKQLAEQKSSSVSSSDQRNTPLSTFRKQKLDRRN